MAAGGADDVMDVEAEAVYGAPPRLAPDVHGMVAAARAELQRHLAAHAVHHVVPAQSTVLIVDAHVSALSAFRSLGDNDVRAAAVLMDGRLCGMLTLATALHAASEPLLMNSALSVLVARSAVQRLLCVSADAPQLHAARLLSHSAAPPLAVMHANEPLHWLFAERLLSILQPRFRHAPFLQCTVRTLSIGRYADIVSADVRMRVEDAASVMVSRALDSLPVTANGVLCGVLDGELLGAALVRADSGAAAVAGAAVGDFMRAARVCSRDDSLREVVDKLSDGCRRVFVVEQQRVVGVIGLRHLLRFFLPQQQQQF